MRFAFFICAVFILGAIGVSYSVSVFYAQNNNQEALDNLQYEAQQTQKFMVRNIEGLTARLLSKVSQQDVYFDFIGLAQRTTGRITSVYPHKYKQMLKSLKISKSDGYPVAFQFFNPRGSSLGRTLFIIRPHQLESASAAKYSNQIIFGLLSPQGMLALSQTFKSHNVEGFVVQESSQWVPVHSQEKYSGQLLPQWSFVRKFKQSYKQGWKLSKEDRKKLSVGIPMEIMKSYLVINYPSQTWKNHFESIFYEVSFILSFAVAIVLFLSYLFFHPIREAYRHVYWWINSFTLTNSLPVPNSNEKNIYIQKLQKGMIRIFMKIRDSQLSQIDAPLGYEMFSNIIQKVCNSYCKEAHLQLDADIKLKTPLQWLEQPLVEIVKNSTEAMEGRNIHLEISTFKEDGMFCCTIRDYGPGMGSLLMNKACQPYYTSKPHAKGLGLTLAYSSLSRAGCRLYFRNAKSGQGLEVQISIPLSKEVGYSASHDVVYDS